MASFFFINYCYIHLGMCITKHTCPEVHKHNLSSPYSVISLYDFRAEHLGLDKQLTCSSLRKLISPVLNIPQLPVILCEGLRPYGISLMYFDMSIVVLLVLFRQPCRLDFMCVAFQACLEDTISLQPFKQHYHLALLRDYELGTMNIYSTVFQAISLL